jgi:hypothetical protein
VRRICEFFEPANCRRSVLPGDFDAKNSSRHPFFIFSALRFRYTIAQRTLNIEC